MSNVRILLSAKTKIEYYVEAVKGVGGEPDAKYLPDIDTGYDGLILCGGSDIDPCRYNEPIDGSVNIDGERDEVEFALLRAYVDAGKPVLGICRGFQLINIFFGGSLYQDIPEAGLHTNKSDFDISHRVTASENSIVGELYGKDFSVNSAHHQAVKRLGDGLCATAFWEGKYVEAFEHTSLPIFAFQWHPERMCFGQRRGDTVDGSEIFRRFITICEKQKETK